MSRSKLNNLKGNKMINAIQNKYYGFWAFIAVSLMCNSAFAAGSTATGLDETGKSFITTITSLLGVIAGGIATIAVFIFGYQVSFGGKSPQQAAPVLIGGLIIGAAAAIGSALTGKTVAPI
jgi:type IV secretion system protein VirB2